MAAQSRGAEVESAAPASPGRAGRDLPAAIGVGVGLGALVICSLAFYKAAFLLVVVLFLAIAMWELGQAMAARGVWTPLPVLVLAATGMQAAAYYGGPRVLVVVLAGAALVAILERMPRGADGFVRDVTAAVFCLVYVGLLASFVPLLLVKGDGVEDVIAFIVVTAASDVGGYAVGATLGRHPMAPAISPKKSWEGFAGSAATCVVAGVLLVTLLLDGAWWVGVVLGLAAVVAATLGDLAESMIKRDLGIKDMSNLLPGHGGAMDRMDSLLATVPVVWLVVTYLLPAV